MAYIIYNQSFRDNYFNNINDFCNFEQILDDYIQKDKLDNLHIILPTHRIIKYLQYKLIDKYFYYHKKPLSNYNICNLQDFANLLFTQIHNISKSQEISDALRLIIFEEAYSKAKLEFFNQKNNRAKYEIIRRLNELVYGIREDGFDKIQAANDLQLIATGDFPEEIEGYKYSDILRMLIEYENLLGNDLFDKPAKLQKILQFMNSKTDNELSIFFEKIYSKNDLVLAYGFSEFKMPEVDLLSIFAKVNIPFALVLDFSPDNGPLFGNFFEYIEKFAQYGLEVYSDDKIFEENEQYLSMEGYDNYFFRKHLFHFDNKKLIHLNKPIRLIEAQNKRDEVKKIAKLIKYLHFKKGIKLEDIAVVSRIPDDYTDYFREIFKIEKIPANITDRFKLWKSPIVNKIYAFIEFALNGYKISSLKRLFNNTSINFNFNVDIDNLVYLANELRIKPRFYPITAEYWIKTLESFKSFYQNSILNMEDAIDIYRLKKLIAKIEQGINDINTIQNNVQIITITMTGNEFRDFVINDIVLKFNFNQNLRQKIKKITEITNGEPEFFYEDIEKEARGLQKFLEVVNDIAFLYDSHSNEKFNLREWYERLKIGVYNERYQITERMNNSVDITSIEQIRYIPYKVKILCGASEGIFPSAYSPEKLFGKELADAKGKHIRTERVLFYQFLSSSNFLFKNDSQNEIYIFYPLTIQGYLTPSSPFIDSLKSIVEIEDENIFDIEKSNDKFSIITNESEVFEYIGFHDNLFSDNFDNSINDNEILYDVNNYLKKNNLFDELEYHKEIKQLKKEDILAVKIQNSKLELQLNDKSFSISELETYSKCPYQYYAKYILRISEAKEKGLTLEPIELGSFLHKILYEFYQELIKNNIATDVLKIVNNDGEIVELKYVKLNPEELSSYRDILLKVAERNLQMPIKDYQILNYQIRQLLDFSFSRNILNNWLKFELNKKDWQFYPSFFEQQFDAELILNKQINPNVSLGIRSIKVNGKIDRIEINYENEILEFAVSDYKLSQNAIPKLTDITNLFISYQIPIYMMGFQQFLLNSYNIRALPGIGIYYLLNPVGVKKQNYYTMVLENPELQSVLALTKINPDKSSELNSVLENSLESAINIKDNIFNGIFPVTPYDKEKICTYCPYFTICRIRQL